MQISDLQGRLPARLRNLSVPDWRSPVWLRGAEAVLTVVLAWQLGGLVWQLWPAGAETTKVLAAASADGGSARGGGGGEDALTGLSAARGLFGTPQGGGESASQTAVPEGPVRETRLNLTLKGVLGGGGEQGRWAIIAASGGEEKAYGVGDRVPGNATIVRIEARRVLLRRNGVTEALKMPEAEAITAFEGGGSTAGAGTAGGGDGIRKVEEHHRVTSREYVNRQLQDLPNLLRQAKAVPHKVDGEHRGFKIVNIQPGSVYEELGLREGDVIQSVNGRDIRSPDQAMEAYKELRSNSSFRVQVQRDGQSTTLQYSVK